MNSDFGLGEGESSAPSFEGVADALAVEDTAVRLFGKPEVHGERRLGVALALGESLEEARKKATEAAAKACLEPVDILITHGLAQEGVPSRSSPAVLERWARRLQPRLHLWGHQHWLHVHALLKLQG